MQWPDGLPSFDEPCFKAEHVRVVTGATEADMQNWPGRGLFKPAAAVVGSRTGRRYSTASLVQAETMVSLSRMGIPVSTAATFGEQVVVPFARRQAQALQDRADALLAGKPDIDNGIFLRQSFAFFYMEEGELKYEFLDASAVDEMVLRMAAHCLKSRAAGQVAEIIVYVGCIYHKVVDFLLARRAEQEAKGAA